MKEKVAIHKANKKTNKVGFHMFARPSAKSGVPVGVLLNIYAMNNAYKQAIEAIIW